MPRDSSSAITYFMAALDASACPIASGLWTSTTSDSLFDRPAIGGGPVFGGAAPVAEADEPRIPW